MIAKRTMAALFAIAVVTTPAGAEPTAKPDITLKTKAAEISVSVDAAIKADPALAANCLAEGKRWADKHRGEAEEAHRDDPKIFPKDGYGYERNYVTASVVGDRYVSLLRKDYEYSGGAHPNSYTDTILWDRSVKKRISIRPFFAETADNGPTMNAMVKAIVAALKEEKKKRDIEDSPEMDWYKGIEPSLLKLGPVSLAPSTEAGKSSGLTFNYSPYAVGSYAEGAYRAFVPWQTLKPYLSAEGAAIFRGERPASDKDAD
ncbi:DUF3298 domain-containing protein [Bradyrhizobium sp. WD16]|uniref:DUF3298 and DUF4163 domain-containing protein n=1 Tax=Bradyrhizobium sp. WD16 TaxID=1521768 RepID=UPI0021F995DD|nr:hypothetical protein DB459_26400 [Bradyrhizobium sp. WD16]